MVHKQKTFNKCADWHLYDVDNNKRVTINELRKMIISGIDIKVVDEHSGDDITVASLLYIIVEKEKSIKSRNSAVLLA